MNKETKFLTPSLSWLFLVPHELKVASMNFVSLFKNQGWEPVGDVVIDDNIGTCVLQNETEIQHFFIVCGEDSHSVSGSVKYDKEMAEAFEANVAPIIYSIKVK